MQASKNGLRYPRGASNIAAGFPGPCFMTSQSTPTLVSLRGRRKKFLDPKPDFSIAGGVNFSAHVCLRPLPQIDFMDLFRTNWDFPHINAVCDDWVL